jgi:acyl dehydratase
MAAAVARTYFEDVAVDAVSETPALTLTEAHAGLYGGLTGDTAAPGLVPDLLPLCVLTGLGWRVPQPPLYVLAFMGLEWTVERPLRVGDTMRTRSRVVTKRAMREGGIVIERREILDQRDEVVQHGRFTYLVGRRPLEVTP